MEWTGPFGLDEEYWYNTMSNESTWATPLESLTKQVQILERLATELGQVDDGSPPVATGRRLRLKHRSAHGSSDVSAPRSRRSRKHAGSPTSPETPETAPETPATQSNE